MHGMTFIQERLLCAQQNGSERPNVIDQNVKFISAVQASEHIVHFLKIKGVIK
jgi:hypothetical protein